MSFPDCRSYFMTGVQNFLHCMFALAPHYAKACYIMNCRKVCKALVLGQLTGNIDAVLNDDLT